MNDFTNPLYGVDVKGGLALIAGNAKIYARLLQTYYAGDLYEKFVGAYNAGDVEATRVAAHTLKGVAGNLHLDAMFEKIKNVEGTMKDSHEMPTDQEMNELEQIQNATMNTIKNLIDNPELIEAQK